ncbi:MAG: type II toxin-antitoxin system PemK/MazF family toxin [Sporichthyaceae bacterium]
MRRGDVCVAAARGSYSGKPRPVVVLQDDLFDATSSVTIAPFTTSTVEAPLLRLAVEPSASNGLDRPSSIMVDKVTTVPRAGIGPPVGRLADTDVVRLNRALVVFLGLAT